MENYNGNICREHLFSVISVYFSKPILPFLGTLTLLNILPAFLYGCSVPEPLPQHLQEKTVNICLTKTSGDINELDIFVFEDDRMQRLDCYQKITDPLSWNEEVVSGNGDRLIAVCANSRKSIQDWSFLSSLAALKEIRMQLEDDSIESPFMSGIMSVPSGESGRQAVMNILPLYCSVELRSLCCDFSDKPYAGEKMTDVKVYLTNVNGECGIFDTNDILPSRIINAGRLCEEDMDMLPAPSMLMREIPGEVGRNIIYPDINLICYPNNSNSESPGTPFTRLVIEGKISGSKYYWPININREDSGGGVCRNERYIYNVRITRKGSTDPDIPVKTEDMDIRLTIEKWTEKEDYPIIF